MKEGKNKLDTNIGVYVMINQLSNGPNQGPGTTQGSEGVVQLTPKETRLTKSCEATTPPPSEDTLPRIVRQLAPSCLLILINHLCLKEVFQC